MLRTALNLQANTVLRSKIVQGGSREVMPLHPTMHVVVVDDDEMFRESLGFNLGEHGFSVADFNDGAVALKHFTDGGIADAGSCSTGACPAWTGWRCCTGCARRTSRSRSRDSRVD